MRHRSAYGCFCVSFLVGAEELNYDTDDLSPHRDCSCGFRGSRGRLAHRRCACVLPVSRQDVVQLSRNSQSYLCESRGSCRGSQFLDWPPQNPLERMFSLATAPELRSEVSQPAWSRPTRLSGVDH